MPLVNIAGFGRVSFPEAMGAEEIKSILSDKFIEVKEFVNAAYDNMSPLDKGALFTSPVPFVGDAIGLAADITTMVQDPESRTVINGLFAAAGALPFIPSGLASGRKALNAGRVESSLSMAVAARKAREKEAGFFPNTLYHGTSTAKSKGEIFNEFQLFEGEDLSRSVSRSPVGKLGVSLGETPEVADEFARMASPGGGEGAAILPVKFRGKKVASIDLDGSESNNEIFSTVSDAWKEGFDAIQFKNYTTPSGETGKSFVLVREPSQIRSVNAAFDPAKKESAKLLAGTAAASVGLGVSSNAIEKDDTI